MALEAASNCWTINEAKIASAVANSAAFQALTSTADATAAAAYVFGEQLDEPFDGTAYTKDDLANLRHYAQVYHSQEQPYGIAKTTANRMIPFGTAVLYVERWVTEQEMNGTDVPQAVERLFKNRIGDLMDDIPEWLEENGGPHIRSITVVDGPGYNDRSKHAQQGVWQGCGMEIQWGQIAL